MIKVKDVYEYLDSVFPFSTQCSWDNSGFLAGDINGEVKKIGFALDVTTETLNRAVKENVDLIITHHPLIFHPVKTLIKGDMPYEVVKAGVPLISCHTNFDKADGGVNDILAEILELKNVAPFPTCEGDNLGRIGACDPLSAEDFARFAAKKLRTTVSLVKGRRKIKTVAVVGGSGGEYVPDAVNAGVDAFLTGEAKHHQLLQAKNSGLTFIVAGHYETENPAMKKLISLIGSRFPGIENIDLRLSNPVSYISPEAF